MKLKTGMIFRDLTNGYQWRLEKRWTYKGIERMWTCKAVDKQPLQPEEKDWFIGDINEGLEKC